MTARNFYGDLIQECRRLIKANLPKALASARIPQEDHQEIINRVLGRLPVSISDRKARGIDPALVVGLGLLEAPRQEKGFHVAPVTEEVRNSFTKFAFSDYTWDEEEYLDAEFEEFTEALDLLMVARDIGGEAYVDIVGLSNQIDIFRQVAKSPLVTKVRALAAYKSMQQAKVPTHKPNRRFNSFA